MDITSFRIAVREAFAYEDTTAIKGILRQCYHAHGFFSSVRRGRAEVPAGDLYPGRKLGFCVYNYWLSRIADPLGNNLLRLGLKISDYDLVKLLLRNGVEVTRTDEDNQTVLHIACKTATLEIIKLLTEKSPSDLLGVPDNYGYTPLDYACQYRSPDVVRFLLAEGSSVGTKDENRQPVRCAASNKVAEYRGPIISLLLEADANVNYGENSYRTPQTAAVDTSIYKNYTCRNHYC